jgi:hypothetical protein
VLEPLVSIIILNWNGWQDTKECLESVHQTKYVNYKVIVIDNGSSDGSVLMIKNSYPDLLILENGVNLGFAAGNNIGINYAVDKLKSDYVFLLNNDTVIDPYCIEELIKIAESNKSVGIVGAKLYDYGTNNIQLHGGKINWWLYPGYCGNYSNINQDIECDWVSGAAMLIRTTMEVYTFNQLYYFGCEDIDLCLRVKKYGYKCIASSSSIVWHKDGVSRKKRRFTKIKDIQTSLLFTSKNHPLMLPLHLLQATAIECKNAICPQISFIRFIPK